MKAVDHNINHRKGIIKDAIIIIVIFAALYFIGIRMAAFVAVLCIVILLTRRIILELNPGFIIITGHKILFKGKELQVPKGVDIFDLNNVPSVEHLYNYIEVIRGIMHPPSILITRFTGIYHLDEFELDILMTVIDRLKRSEILLCSLMLKKMLRPNSSVIK